MKRILFASILFVFAFSACKKDLSQGEVVVTVTNENGVPIQNCQVLLSVPVDNSIEYYGITDINGQISFASGLHIFMDVTVWKGLWEGCDFVEIKPGDKKNKKVIIYPPSAQFNGCL